MILYSYPASPNTRRISIYLKEKGLKPPYEEIIVDLMKGQQLSPDFLKINPLGKVPALLTDNGTVINQSLNIVEYLEELYPESPMIGNTPEERARVKSIERFIDMEIMGTMGIIAQQKMPLYVERFGSSEETISYGRKRQQLALEQLETMVGNNPFIAGDKPTIADITLFAIYEFAFLVDASLGPEYPKLFRWHQAFSNRPSVSTDEKDDELMEDLKQH